MSIATLERAFEIADSGACSNMTDLRRALARERLDQVDANLSGSAIQKQLIARMDAAELRRARNGGQREVAD